MQNGRLTGTTLGSVNDNWTYTGFGEAQTYTASAGSTTLYAMDFARDNAGRITNKLEVIGGVLSSYDYTYDPDRGWLTDVASNGVAVAHYVYDDNGNRLTHQTLTDTVTGVYDDQDRLLSLTPSGPVLPTTYTYSANGELQTKQVGGNTVAFSYDVRGSLRDVTLANGTVVSYVIDARGHRIGKKINGVLVKGWLYQNHLKPIVELNGAGQIVSRFVYGHRLNVPAYMIKGSNTYRLITDNLGSVRLVVNTASGLIAQRLNYDEFGRVLADTNPGFQPFGYAGGHYDEDTKLVNFGVRDYDAESGRWTSKDPIGFGGGRANLFEYVGNDPINWFDPYGNQQKTDHGVGEGFKLLTTLESPWEKYSSFADKAGYMLDSSAYLDLYKNFDVAQSNKAASLAGATDIWSTVQYYQDARNPAIVSNAVQMGIDGIAIPAYNTVAGAALITQAPLALSSAATCPKDIWDWAKEKLMSKPASTQPATPPLYLHSNGSIFQGWGNPPGPGYIKQ